MLWALFTLAQIYIQLWWEQSYILRNYLKWVLLFLILSWTVATYAVTAILLFNGLAMSMPNRGIKMIDETCTIMICFWLFIGVFVIGVLSVSINAMVRQFRGIKPPDDEVVLNKIAYLKKRIEKLEDGYRSLAKPAKVHGKK